MVKKIGGIRWKIKLPPEWKEKLEKKKCLK
jgi:hypothetical protein